MDNILQDLHNSSSRTKAEFNNCFVLNIEAWKWARENPLFKNGKSNDMDNYRPISVLPTISKVLERVVHTQFYDFLA